MTNFNRQHILIVSVCLFSIFSSCSSRTNQEFEYKPLNSFQNDTSAILPNSEVKILAFSGTIDKNLDAVYYSQILVLNTVNNDTLSILCPTLKIPSTDNSSAFEFVSPTKFDPSKNIRNATYERIDSTTQIAMQVLDEATNKPINENEIGKTVEVNINLSKKELVAINKTIPLFQRQYKTVIGILKFSTDIRK